MEEVLEDISKEVYKWILFNINGYTKEEIENMDFESEYTYHQLLDIIVEGCKYDEV
jgi:hypothetical protein